MYIEYSSDQKAADFVDTTSYRLAVRGGTFRPTWLIRTRDWKKVPGNEAQNGYCTLSYCWEQSGGLIPKAYKNTTNTITKSSNTTSISISNHSNLEEHKLIQTPKKEQRQHRSKCLRIFSTFNNSKDKPTIAHVSFERLVQQICHDFQIDYLWYDKICIDSNNDNDGYDEETKLGQIKNMHRIYAHANYTVALVPEIKVHHSKDFACHGNKKIEWCIKARSKALMDLRHSSWFKNSWSLAEVMMSQSILVVGQDLHFWQQSQQLINETTNIIPADILYGFLLNFPARLHRLQQQQSTPASSSGANQVFHQAYFRRSTCQHDNLFALLNIFYPVIQNVQPILANINYTTINLHHAFQDLYRAIAAIDLSILFFGVHNPRIYGPVQGCPNTMHDYYTLPSWTGIYGWHLAGNVVTTTLSETANFVNANMDLHIPFNKAHRVYPVPYNHNNNSSKYKGRLFNNSQRNIIQKYSKCLNKMNNQKDPTRLVGDDFLINKYHFELLAHFGCVTTHFLKDTQKNHHFAPAVLSLTEDVSDNDECFALSVFLDNQSCLTESVNTGVINSSFPVVGKATNNTKHVCFYPVIKKNATTGKYKAIGIYYIGQLNEEQASNSRKFLVNLFEKDKVETFILE